MTDICLRAMPGTVFLLCICLLRTPLDEAVIVLEQGGRYDIF